MVQHYVRKECFHSFYHRRAVSIPILTLPAFCDRSLALADYQNNLVRRNPLCYVKSFSPVLSAIVGGYRCRIDVMPTLQESYFARCNHTSHLAGMSVKNRCMPHGQESPPAPGPLT